MSPSTQMQAVKPTEITHKMSQGVTQNLIRALFSELCFARNIFPADAFKEQSVRPFPPHALANAIPRSAGLA